MHTHEAKRQKYTAVNLHTYVYLYLSQYCVTGNPQ